MVHPGAFGGLRKEFLIQQKVAYSAAVGRGHSKDTLADIQRRYFKRFPIDLPHEEELLVDHLASIDDDEADPEPTEPDKDKLSIEEYAAEMAKLDAQRKLIVFRKDQIKRWLAYQYMKDAENDPQELVDASNPYHLLLCQLTGLPLKLPRLSMALNIWRRDHHKEIEDELSRRARAEGRNRKFLAPLCEKVAKEIFGRLSQAERDQYAEKAKQEQQAATEEWKKEVSAPPSSCPADRERCIQNLIQFAQPILDSICAVTGWKVTLITGGPEPSQEGRLNMISIHSGVTKGDIKMTFSRAEQARYQEHIIPIFGDFLKKCYSKDDCLESALWEDGVNVMGVENVDSPSVSASDEGVQNLQISVSPSPESALAGNISNILDAMASSPTQNLPMVATSAVSPPLQTNDGLPQTTCTDFPELDNDLPSTSTPVEAINEVQASHPRKRSKRLGETDSADQAANGGTSK